MTSGACEYLAAASSISVILFSGVALRSLRGEVRIDTSNVFDTTINTRSSFEGKADIYCILSKHLLLWLQIILERRRQGCVEMHGFRNGD
jgi:hypothetical protein